MAGFPNLPGVNVTLNDLGLKIAPPPAGPKVTLLGITSNDTIPLREPLTVTNIGQATSSLWAGFTGDNYPSELAIGIEEASAAGAENIEIVVIANRSGAGYTNYLDPLLTGQDERYNDLTQAYDAILNQDLDVVVPLGAWVDATGVNFGKQLANFCHQASKEVDNACIGVLPMMNVNEWASCYTGVLSPTYGNEVSAISGQAEYLFGLPSLALVGEWVKYASQTDTPLVSALPTHWDTYLAGSEDENAVFWPLNDENNATDVNASYFVGWKAANIDGSAAVDNKGNPVDAGRRISVVGTPLQTATTQLRGLARGVGAALSNTVQVTNGATAYGGFITTLPPQSSPTNKRIRTLAPQRRLSPSQANKLAGRRIVPFHQRANGFVVSNAMTGAHNVSKFVRSDFVRLTTMRVVDSIVDLVRAVSEKYIGEPNTAAQRNALSNEIDRFLKNMRVVGAINGYSFVISATPEQQVLGEATIDLTVVPPFEIIKIQTNISLAETL
jgi:hypothetical protein